MTYTNTTPSEASTDYLVEHIIRADEAGAQLTIGTWLESAVMEIITRAQSDDQAVAGAAAYWVGHFATWWSTPYLDDAEAKLPNFYRVPTNAHYEP
jgi:hypothetical protein